MEHLRSMLGYLWALIALPIILATFIGQDFWAHQLVAVTGLHVSPWLTGGTAVQTIDHRQYRTILHRPVFDGIIGQRRQGFVQIDWKAVSNSLPAEIDELIDYDRDGIADFQIKLNTKADNAKLITKKPYVLGISQIYNLKNERVIRVSLKAKNK